MFRKLLLLLLFITGVARAQTYTTPGVPTGTISFSPTWRYIGTDSLANFWLNNSSRWSLFYSAAQSNQRFITRAGGLYYPLSFGYGFVTTSNYNGSSAITAKIDSTVFQTKLGLFPLADARYVQKDTAYHPVTGSSLISLVNGAGKAFTDKHFKYNMADSSVTLGQLGVTNNLTAGHNIAANGDYVQIQNTYGEVSSLVVTNSSGINGNQVLLPGGYQLGQGWEYGDKFWHVGTFPQYDWLRDDGLNLFTKNYINYNSRTLAFGSGIGVSYIVNGSDTIRTLSVTGTIAPSDTTALARKNGSANMLQNTYTMPSLSTAPTTTRTSGTVLFSLNNRMSYKNLATGYYRSEYSNYPGNAAYKFPYLSTSTLADSAQVANSVSINKALILTQSNFNSDHITYVNTSLSGNTSYLLYLNGAKFLIPNTDFTYSSGGGFVLTISGYTVGSNDQIILMAQASVGNITPTLPTTLISYKTAATYASMIADGTPTSGAIIYEVTADENKSYTRSTYIWKANGKREWLASTPDN